MKISRWQLILVTVCALVFVGAGIYLQKEHTQKKPAQGSRSAGSIWGADYFPNVPLITHEGKTVRFFDDLIKDKVVVINFIFTSCPDSCPLETSRLRRVQTLLGDRVGLDLLQPWGRPLAKPAPPDYTPPLEYPALPAKWHCRVARSL